MNGRFPFEPLLDAAGRPNLKHLARVCGAHPRQIYRWRETGLSDEHADRAACSLGLHPMNVWPNYLEVTT